MEQVEVPLAEVRKQNQGQDTTKPVTPHTRDRRLAASTALPLFSSPFGFASRLLPALPRLHFSVTLVLGIFAHHSRQGWASDLIVLRRFSSLSSTSSQLQAQTRG